LESKILRVLVVLGVPGVALGVFYLLLRQFNFQFETISPTWSALIAILFLLIVGFVTFYTIHKWAPERDKQGIVNNRLSSNDDLLDIRIKTTWGVPTGIGPHPNSLLCIEVQNHSTQIFYFRSLVVQLSNGKSMAPIVDAFGKQIPGPKHIDPGTSLSVHLDFLEIIRTATEAGAAIECIVVRDQIDRMFYSLTEEMQIAISNVKIWQKELLL
jgi:hypothetical protein